MFSSTLINQKVLTMEAFNAAYDLSNIKFQLGALLNKFHCFIKLYYFLSW